MKRSYALRRLRALIVVLLALALSPTLVSRGQDSAPALARESLGAVEVIEQAPPAGAGLAALAPAETKLLHLPLVLGPPKVTVQFASSIDGSGNLVNPATTFAYGITNLHYAVTVMGAKDWSYREEWTINGARTPELDYGPVTISFDAVRYHGRIFYSSGRPLARGTYQLNVFLNGALYRTGVATIT